MKAKVGVLGHFGEGKNLLNGQTVKTKIVTEELCRQLGGDRVLKIDTHGGMKTLLKAPFQVFRALKNSENVLILPAHNGLRVYAPLLAVLKPWFKGRKLHYVVIGGWLPEFLRTRPRLLAALRQFAGIYVETNTMKRALEQQGFANVHVMPNCKKLTALKQEELIYPKETPLRLCTFSRVMKEKGIEDAVEAVKEVNEQLGYTAYSLDIYGQVHEEQTEWFGNMKKMFPDYIQYRGVVSFDRSVEVLKDYFALLFPTHFYTEGIPGTIIDAYAAGVPVISAKWESYADIVDDHKTGIGYQFEDVRGFFDVLMQAEHNSQLLLDMKENCIRKAKEYVPETAIQVLLEQLEIGEVNERFSI